MSFSSGKAELTMSEIRNETKEICEAMDLLRQRAIKLVSTDICTFRTLPREFRADREIALAAINLHPNSIEQVEGGLKTDKELAMVAVKKSSFSYQYVQKDLRKENDLIEMVIGPNTCSEIMGAIPHCIEDRNLLLKMMDKKERVTFARASDVFKTDYEFIIHGIKNGLQHALEFACDEFKSNRDIVLEAAKSGVSTLGYCNSKYKEDEEIVEHACNAHGFLELFHAHEKFKFDRRMLLIACKKNADRYLYRYVVPKCLQCDFELVYTLFSTNPDGNLGKYLDEEFGLWKNVDFVRYVAEKMPEEGNAKILNILNFRSRDVIPRSPDVILTLLKKKSYKGHIPTEYIVFSKDDRDRITNIYTFIYGEGSICADPFHGKEFNSSHYEFNRTWLPQALKAGGDPIRYEDLPLSIWYMDDVVEKIVEHSPHKIVHAPIGMKFDKEIVLKALANRYREQDPVNLFDKLKYDDIDDIDVAKAFCAADGLLLEKFPTKFQKMEEIVEIAVNKNGLAMRHADGKFRQNEKILLAATRNNYKALQYASAFLRRDLTFMIDAVKQSPFAIDYAYGMASYSPLLKLYAGIGLKAIATQLEQWNHSYTIDKLEEFQEAATYHLSKRRDPITNRFLENRKLKETAGDTSYWDAAHDYAERIAKVVYAPRPVRIRRDIRSLKRDLAEMMGGGEAGNGSAASIMK